MTDKRRVPVLLERARALCRDLVPAVGVAESLRRSEARGEQPTAAVIFVVLMDEIIDLRARLAALENGREIRVNPTAVSGGRCPRGIIGCWPCGAEYCG